MTSYLHNIFAKHRAVDTYIHIDIGRSIPAYVPKYYIPAHCARRGGSGFLRLWVADVGGVGEVGKHRNYDFVQSENYCWEMLGKVCVTVGNRCKIKILSIFWGVSMS